MVYFSVALVLVILGKESGGEPIKRSPWDSFSLKNWNIIKSQAIEKRVEKVTEMHEKKSGPLTAVQGPHW